MADYAPVHIVEIAFDDPAVTSPTWTAVTTYVRGIEGLDLFSTSRGRENELDQVDAGTVTVNLDNRDRRFDPTNTSSPYNPNVLPMRRIRIRATWVSTTYDVFYGYIEDWNQNWTDPGSSNATCTIRAVDAFKPLAVPKLGQLDPPVDTYQEVIASDNPYVYIPLTEPAGATVVHCAIGGRDSDGVDTAAPTMGVTGLLRGEAGTAAKATAADVGFRWITANGHIANFAGTNTVTLEAWIRVDTVGTVHTWIFRGRGGAVSPQFSLEVNASEQVVWRINTGSDTAITGATTLTAGQIYHAAGTYDGANMRLYLNGVIDAGPTAKTGNVLGSGVDETVVDGFGAGGIVLSVGHVGIYNAALSIDRLLAHYQAGQSLVFAQEASGTRIANLLDAAASAWPAGLRNLQAGVRTVQAVKQLGQGVLDEIKNTVTSEGKDSIFFAAKDGKLTFLQNTYRASSPYNTSQATFGDSTGEVPYEGLTLSYDDSHLYNHIQVTRRGGNLVEVSDSTSITKYLKRSISQSDLLLVDDSTVSTHANELLTKLKNPSLRITSITLDGADTGAQTQMLVREIGDAITIKRRPPGGGSVISQLSYIQKIEITARAGETWKARFVVTPD